ncbi:MAG: glycosyltransferase [Candidatus Diapherotrites archaeon]|nr:glycosyltransferase [Candidatus Diapherotrites archaeon]
MFISIVVAALNEEKYIRNILRSLKNQRTKHKYEIIVCDGYSEDKTAKIAKEEGVKVVFQRKRSAAWERQTGAKYAKGEIIAFVDADCKVPEDWVDNIVKEFQKDKGLVLVYGSVYFSDSGKFYEILSKNIMCFFLYLCSFFGVDNVIGSNMAVRKKVFFKIGGFNTNLITAEDLDLAKRIKKQGKIKFCSNLAVDVSSRRIKKWGFFKYIVFHTYNAIKFHISGKSIKEYEVVR